MPVGSRNGPQLKGQTMGQTTGRNGSQYRELGSEMSELYSPALSLTKLKHTASNQFSDFAISNPSSPLLKVDRAALRRSIEGATVQ